MTILDLIKATVVCGAIAFLIYSYPLIGQIVLIAFLSLLWLRVRPQDDRAPAPKIERG